MFEIILGLFLAVGIPLGLGYSVVIVLFQKRPLGILFSLALAYGLGMGLLTQWMLILGALKIPLGVATIGLPLISLTIGLSIAITVLGKNIKPLTLSRSNVTEQKWDVLSIILALYVLYCVVYIFWRSLSIPIADWDAIATIAFKAKVFFDERSLAHLKTLPYDSYPLHVSFLETWIAMNLSHWDDQLIKVIFPLTFLSYLSIQYYFLRIFVNRRWALLGNILLVGSNFFMYHATIGYRDFTLMYYNCVTIILLTLWNCQKEDAYLVMAGLFSGFTTFSKMEGMIYLLLHVIILIFILVKINPYSFLNSLRKLCKFGIPSFGIYFIYFFYKFFTKAHLVKQGTEISLSWDNLNRIPTIIYKFLENLFLTGNWNLIWVLFLLSIINPHKVKQRAAITIPLFTLAIFGVSFFLFFLLTPYFEWISVPGKEDALLSRIILHCFPLSTILIILLNSPSQENHP